MERAVTDTAAPLLDVEGLRIELPAASGPVAVVDGVSLRIAAGETLGLVGESGCGKTMTGLALIRLVPPPLRVAGGRALLNGEDLLRLPERQMQALRGRAVAMVFQEAATALDPLRTVGYQISEP